MVPPSSSPARIPDWEREEGNLSRGPPASCLRPVISADVVSCSHPRLGARGGEPQSRTPGLVPSPCISADVVSCSHPRLGARGGEPPSRMPGLVPSPRRDDILLSPNAPGEGDNSFRLASSSTTHSVTGPAPRASMKENPANAISVSSYGCSLVCSSMFLYLPLSVYTLYIYFFYFSFILPVGPHANPRQQSHFSHIYSFSGPCGGQILVSVFIFLFACVLRCLRPYQMVHCGCRHPSSLDSPWWSGVPITSSLECGAGGVSAPRVSRHTLSLKTETWMKR